MLEKIKKNPRFKHFLIGLISSHKNPRPRLWVRWFVNPFVHKKGRGAVVRSRRSRHDLFPWHRFEVGRGALVEQFTVLNNGAGDILIGAGARVGIGSVVIGPVRMGERAGLGQHVFVAGFNHGYADATRDSNVQPLVVREVVIGRESHIGANSVVVAGVHIGERVQVGAGSVVTKDIPSYCVAAGNPARIIKRYDFRRRRWVRTDDGLRLRAAPAGTTADETTTRAAARVIRQQQQTHSPTEMQNPTARRQRKAATPATSRKGMPPETTRPTAGGSRTTGPQPTGKGTCRNRPATGAKRLRNVSRQRPLRHRNREQQRRSGRRGPPDENRRPDAPQTNGLHRDNTPRTNPRRDSLRRA